MENWYLLRSGPGASSWNMALDEALLESSGQLGRPVLRFYAWTEPAATFGYSQNYAEVARMTPLRPLIRRTTGGGLVPHEADWTYSLVFPPQHPWYRLRAAESYLGLHTWIRRAFVALEVEAQLSPSSQKEIPGQCFAGPEQSDLTWRGRKIAGAAQRRAKHGLLIQGSIQPPVALDRSRWEESMLEQAQVDWTPLPSQLFPSTLAAKLDTEKYSRLLYNEKR